MAAYLKAECTLLFTEDNRYFIRQSKKYSLFDVFSFYFSINVKTVPQGQI